MLMVCIVNEGYSSCLTLGKVYDAIINKDEYSPIKVVDDSGRTFNYDDTRFIGLDEWRANKLKKLGID